MASRLQSRKINSLGKSCSGLPEKLLFMLPNVGVGVFMFWEPGGSGRRCPVLGDRGSSRGKPGIWKPASRCFQAVFRRRRPAASSSALRKTLGAWDHGTPPRAASVCKRGSRGPQRAGHRPAGSRVSSFPSFMLLPPPLFFQVVKPVLAPRAAPAASRLLRSPCLRPGASRSSFSIEWAPPAPALSR